MLTMTVLSEQSGSITLGVGGKVCRRTLPELDRLIALEQKRRHVLLDLSEVTLLDQEAARFFGAKLLRGVELVNCPPYIRHWISPQIAHESQA
jgi:hypothetical protein